MRHTRQIAEIPDDQPNCLDEEIREVLPVVMRKRSHRGSNLRDFLRDEGLLEEANAKALQRADGLQLERARKQHFTRGGCSRKRCLPN